MVLRVKVGGEGVAARAVVAKVLARVAAVTGMAVMVAAATVAVEPEVAPQGAQAAQMVSCHSTLGNRIPIQQRPERQSPST